MKSSIQILPGIKFIGWLDGNKLQRAVGCAGIVGQSVGIFTDIHEVVICDYADCRRKTEREHGAHKDTVTLKFLSVDRIPYDRMPNIAFVVTDVNDATYLIGSLEHPQAEVQCEQLTGIPGGDAAGYSYEVKHCTYRSMVPCHISVDP